MNVQSNLAVNFERMAKVYRTVGDYKSALPYYEQSLAISAKLVETAPTDGLRLAALATAWQHVGDMRFELQDLERAVAAYDAFLEIVDRLANGDPANLEWQRRLSFARERIGDVRGAQGELDAARQAYSTALGIAQRVAATDPSNAIWQRDVIGAHVKIAETAESPSVAQGHYEQALTIARSLYEADLLPPQYHWMVPKLESRLASLTQTR